MIAGFDPDLRAFYAAGVSPRLLTAEEASRVLAALAVAKRVLGSMREASSAHCDCCQTSGRIAESALREMATFLNQPTSKPERGTE